MKGGGQLPLTLARGADLPIQVSMYSLGLSALSSSRSSARQLSHSDKCKQLQMYNVMLFGILALHKGRVFLYYKHLILSSHLNPNLWGTTAIHNVIPV